MSKVDELLTVARELPPEAIEELLRVARSLSGSKPAPLRYRPVALGGLWRGIQVGEEELRAARHDMWKRFEESA